MARKPGRNKLFAKGVLIGTDVTLVMNDGAKLDCGPGSKLLGLPDGSVGITVPDPKDGKRPKALKPGAGVRSVIYRRERRRRKPRH